MDHPDDLDENNKFKNMKAINSALAQMSWKDDEEVPLMFTLTEMKRVEKIHDFLTSLDVYSTTLGGNTFVTSSIVLPIVKSIRHQMRPDENDPSYIATLKSLILEDFVARTKKNLNYSLLVKATALDPRFKNMKVIKEKEKRNDVYDELLEEMKSVKLKPREEENNDIPNQSKKRKLMIEFSDSESDNERDFEVGESYDEVKAEIESYKREELLSQDDDPLQWWSKKKDKYPLLANLAKKYLCVPATSVEAERTFSALGLLLTKQRLHMAGDNVDRQLFMRDKFKKSK